MKRTMLLTVIGAAIVLAGCGANDDPADSAVQTAPTAASATATVLTEMVEMVAIDVKGFVYAPETIEVPVGTTITWLNADQILHTVTSGTPENPDGMIDGQMPDAGTETSHKFDTPGTVTYFCSRHQFMRGEVVVR